MPTVLDEIVARKRVEVEKARAITPLESIQSRIAELGRPRNFFRAVVADRNPKTFRVIAFLAYLKNECNVNGPSLVVAPLSVLTSWVNEFKRFVPSMRVIRLHSARPARGRDPLRSPSPDPSPRLCS